MTDAAPEWIFPSVEFVTRNPRLTEKPRYIPTVEYVRADALTTAQARIAELEAALALRMGEDHDEDCKINRGKQCNCGHYLARRAMEAKP